MMNPAGLDHPWQSRRLWSLWEMLTLNAADFMHLLSLLFDHEAQASRTSGPLSRQMIDTNKSAAEAIRNRAAAMRLPVTKGTATYIEVSNSSEALVAACLTVKRTMHQELLSRQFLEPDHKYIGYYDQATLFGKEVFEAFPSANDDIYEAGMCLALERPTACVMHLNRVLECGLASLARMLGVTKQTDWGAYLRKIAAELDDRAKTSGKRSEDEQFYAAEAAANFDRMRRAWRNPTMHPEKTYSQDRAEEILLAVKSFMIHLASRISEKDAPKA